MDLDATITRPKSAVQAHEIHFVPPRVDDWASEVDGNTLERVHHPCVTHYAVSREKQRDYRNLDEYLGKMVVDVWGNRYVQLYTNGTLKVEFYEDEDPNHTRNISAARP